MQLIYIQLKDFIMLFQNSMFYKGLSNSSQDIEEWNIKKVLTLQKFNKIRQLQTSISSKL